MMRAGVACLCVASGRQHGRACWPLTKSSSRDCAQTWASIQSDCPLRYHSGRASPTYSQLVRERMRAFDMPIHHCDEHVGRTEHVSLEPRRRPINHDGEDHQDRYDEHAYVHDPKVQVHIDAQEPAHHHRERNHEQGHLHRRPHRYTDGEPGPVLDREPDRRRVLARVADDRQQYDANESLAEASLVDHGLYRSDKQLGRD
mmetsp:Transcript_55025/g.146192  ORF Transcript_55025/g.146192 Transcript_55025/m.146192 type:complete len:201 (+) Transcript_55025:48-650(+)